MLAGDRCTDRPKAVCPLIAALLRAYNDAIDCRRRQDLFRYAAACVDTRADHRLEGRRAGRAVAWARARYDARHQRWGGLLDVVPDPGLAAGPDVIAAHVVGSIRRHTDSTHISMLWLLDQLIALGPEPGAEQLSIAPANPLHQPDTTSLSLHRSARDLVPAV